jgi:hypothetical protein
MNGERAADPSAGGLQGLRLAFLQRGQRLRGGPIARGQPNAFALDLQTS